MKVELSSWLYSSTRLILVINELQTYANWYGHEDIRGRVGLGIQVENAPKLSVASLELLADIQKEQTITGATFDELIAALQKIREEAPTITMVLAGIASEPVKQRLVGWVRQEISHQALVTFQCDSTLLGGLVVRMGSHVYDWSFRKKILDQKDEFTKVLNRV